MEKINSLLLQFFHGKKTTNLRCLSIAQKSTRIGRKVSKSEEVQKSEEEAQKLEEKSRKIGYFWYKHSDSTNESRGVKNYERHWKKSKEEVQKSEEKA